MTATAVATRTGAVHSWDLSTGVDGPGTRFTLFLTGCTLRCVYCQNPDTWRVGRGEPTSVEEVMARISRYRRVFDRTGGGVTISGGEPLVQAGFTAAVLHECRALGIHTALDTSGVLGQRAGDDLLGDTSLVLLDIKAFDPVAYTQVTQGGRLAPTLRFAERLSGAGIPMWVRFVVVPGLNDDVAQVEGLAEFVSRVGGVERVDVIGFHRLGEQKYAALHLPLPLQDTPTPTPERLAEVRSRFAARGLHVT